MSKKFQYVNELYHRQLADLTEPAVWQSFLKTACWNYKLTFAEMVLVFAQRPDATAVLPLKQWNNTFGRLVDKGAEGIATIDFANIEKERLKYYFDISNTHGTNLSKPVYQWRMDERYEPALVDYLNWEYQAESGDIVSAIRLAVERTLQDNAEDIPELYEENGVEQRKNLVINSTTAIILERLEIDTKKYFTNDDFSDIIELEEDSLIKIGNTMCDISVDILRQLSRKVIHERQKDRTRELNIVEQSGKERSNINENARDNLHAGRGLQDSGYSLSEERQADSTREVRQGEVEILERASESNLEHTADPLRVEQALDGSGRESGGNVGVTDETDGRETGSNGGTETSGRLALGEEDVEHQGSSGRSNLQGTDLRLEYYDRSNEDKSLPFFGDADTINEMLMLSPYLKASKDEIRDFFEHTYDDAERTEYIKSIFNNDITHLTLQDGRTVGYKTMQNVLHLWEGEYDSRVKQSFYDWGVISKHFEAMRLLGQFDNILPSVEEQIDSIKAEEKSSAFVLYQ